MFMHAEVPGTGVTDGCQVFGINLPSKAMRRAVGHDRHLAPVALASGDPLIQLLTGYIESAKQLPADADPALLNGIGRHLTDLVGLALGPTRDAAAQAVNGGLKSARLDAVLRAIASNYADPEFSVADVAARLKLSVRYVQDLLHETGTGFADRVLELRLQEACNLLSRAHITHRKVSDIAFSCGFNNLSYFHRAFRRRFGVTPAGARSS
jgi:AraC-like DNA-binding protein